MTEPKDLLLDAEPKDLLLVNEQLRQSNRRWKALALTACAVVMLLLVGGLFLAVRQRLEAQRFRAEAAAVVRDYRASWKTQATNPPPPAR